jgi:futalosine hydrolase
MKILLVAATKTELIDVFAHFNLPNQDFVPHVEFDILITGVGITATAFALGKNLNNEYNLVLNVGIAGSFDRQIALGSLVNIVEDTFADLGAEDNDLFLTLDDLNLGKITYQSTYNTSYSKTAQLQKVKGITVNKAHGNIKSINFIKQKFNPTTESMEGAAVFYACAASQLPCLQIRSISNYVSSRDKSTWEIQLAIKNLNIWVINFIENLTAK